MIGKVTRPWSATRLIAYLLGPGRRNEHAAPRVVAAWDGVPQWHQPPQLADGRFDIRQLMAELTAPAAAAGVEVEHRPPGQTRGRGRVWHCSVRAAPGDRVLTDEEWQQVATAVVDRVGIAPVGDRGACRWVAVRHADDHIHIAAVLVRADTGRRVSPYNDYAKVGKVCRQFEARWHLTRTAPPDRTAARQPSRAELEKATRQQWAEPSRSWLRSRVRVAAVQARTPHEFAARLADLGVLCRRIDHGRRRGYAVARPGDVNASGDPVWYAGSRLANDLTMPALIGRWNAVPAPEPEEDAGGIDAQPATDPASPAKRARQRERAVGLAARSAAVAARTATTELRQGVDDDGVVHATADLLTAFGTITGRRDIELRTRLQAAEVYDRAARQAGVGQPRSWSHTARALRSASWRLMTLRALTPREERSDSVGELMLALAGLIAEIAAWHQLRGRITQAAAARATSLALPRPASEAPATIFGGLRPSGHEPQTATAHGPAAATTADIRASRRRRGP